MEASVFEGEHRVDEGLFVLPLRTPTLPPATHTNACLFTSGDEAIVVEPATPHADERGRLRAWLQHHAATGSRVVGIVLTHHHEDHVGAADWLREELGEPLLAHGRTRDRLLGQLRIDRLLEDGEVVLLNGPRPVSIEVLHTPGHAPGHICLFEPSTRALVAGDMVAGTGTILVEPVDGDVGLYLASLERLVALAPSIVVPAHGAPLPPEVLTRTLSHRRMREARILETVRALGTASLDAIVPLAYGDVPVSVWPLARLSTTAHLIELAKRGLVLEDPARGLWLTPVR